MFWELRHSVIANANRQKVWEFVSNIDNLARIEGDAVESMTLDGPFQTGTRGATKMRGQAPTHWRLAEVEPPERATYERELSGAVVRFAWTSVAPAGSSRSGGRGNETAEAFATAGCYGGPASRQAVT